MEFVDRLYLKDARTLTEIFTEHSPCVDTIVTSPPYWDLKNYETEGQIGYGQSKEEYLRDLEVVFKNCITVTKSTGSLWLIVGNYRNNGELQMLPWEIGDCARRAGWKLRDFIVWDKQHSLPWHQKGQMRNVTEFILFMTKTDDFKYEVDRVKTLDEISKWWVDFPERYNPKGKTPTNIWGIPVRTQGKWRTPSDIDHHCPFPTALVARMIELTTDQGDVVMDPFAGSGIVLATAECMSRHFIGFELNPDYIQMYDEIVREEVADEWEEIRNWRKTQARAKADFEQTIMKLRALKYTRQVTKPFLDSLSAEEQELVYAVICLTCIPEQYRRRKRFKVEVWIIVDAKLDIFKKALLKSKERASRPPLTQYGIEPDINLATFHGFSRQKPPEVLRQNFYLYTAYKPRKYVSENTLRYWFTDCQLNQMAEDSKVPMLADIAVDVAWALE